MLQTYFLKQKSMSEFSKKYEPQNFENNLYKIWEESNSFTPKDSKT